jgi:NADPH:quinone reductase-like Zn-dependent oxidoreductase
MTAQMNAAVVTSFTEPPRYQTCDIPSPGDSGTTLVDVLAVGLHPRVRSGAGGAHYTSTGALPMIPGVDAVGRRADGGLIYFAADDASLGTMAEKTLADPRRSVELPAGVDVAQVAAAMNPAMSSWVALRRRITFEPGHSVLILGATGNAGSMAVQIAKLMGAGQIIGAGRDPERLAALTALGADTLVQLTSDPAATATALAEVAGDVDVVIDYLWAEPARAAMQALLGARSDLSAPLDWVQIGALTGPELMLPSAWLRGANLRIQGSGQGSVSGRTYLGELPALVAEIDAGRIAVDARTAALAEVESVWTAPEVPGTRTVLIP